MNDKAEFAHFASLDIRVGTVKSARQFDEARKPAYQLEIDFGEELGIKRSSAQITDLYAPSELIGKQVVAVVNIGHRRIAGFVSEVLVLGAMTGDGVVLLRPDSEVQNGTVIA
ncbi:MAG: chaperone CsaA [Salibacteraceae bacterium]